ncbi:MAG: hypothetical protein HQM09_12430 [Candidatus Riflebacteria bacterium]|nr:hypothetical protein [Candidatus Riflebacteria bacterium]
MRSDSDGVAGTNNAVTAFSKDNQQPSANEARMAFLAAVGFFFIIMAYYVLKPIRESLAIELGAHKVPALNVLSMFSLIIANGFYSWFVGRYRRDVFIPWLIRGSIVCLVFFWLVFRDLAGPAINGGPLAFSRIAAITGYFVWVNIFGLFLPSMFWSFMNDVFSTEQGSRFYSRIGYGGLIGGLAGGGITAILVKTLGTAQMFIVTVFLLEPVLWCMREIDRLSICGKEITSTGAGAADKVVFEVSTGCSPEAAKFRVQKNNARKSRWYKLRSSSKVRAATARTGLRENKLLKDKQSRDGSVAQNNALTPVRKGVLEGVWRTIASPYLGLMALETFLYTFGSSLFSYQVNVLMEHEITSREQRTIYWAHLYNGINGLSLFMQFFVTSYVMRTGSPWVGLALMPGTQIIASLILLGSPSLNLAAIFSIIRYALNYSTGRAVRELFFTPLAREEKYQGKGFIDTFIFRAGDGMASSLLLAGIALMGSGYWIDFSVIGVNAIGVVTIFLIGLNFARITRERGQLH